MMKEYMEKIKYMSAIFNSLVTYHYDNVMVKLLKIAIWNVDGLTKHSQKIKTFIFTQNIDILLVPETILYMILYKQELLSLNTYCTA